MFSGARHGQRTFNMIREIRERVAFISRFLWTEDFGTNVEVIVLAKPKKEFFCRRGLF